jgi:outer membrane lipoprotein carrier protein
VCPCRLCWVQPLVYLRCLRGIVQFEACALLIFSLWPFFWSQNTAESHTAARTPVTVVLRRFEERYRRATRLQVTFLERYTENGRLTRMEAGKAFFLRPGKMRWEYESPEKNVFLVDGKNAWFYVPADHTVTRVPAKKSSDWRTPLALLAGEMKLRRICNRIEPAEQEAREYSADVMLRCELRGASKSTEGGDSGSKAGLTEARDIAYLEVVESSGELVRVLVNDPGGVGIEFRFANWQLNPQVDESFFRFQIPPGVAIVDGELEAAPSTLSP